MSIAEVETVTRIPSHWEIVLRAWEEPDLPEVGGPRSSKAISASWPPKDEHSHIISLIHEWIIKETLRDGGALAEAEVYQDIDVRVPPFHGLYVPDLVVLPCPVLERGTEHLAGEALLVVEVTSKSTARRDRTAKLWGYAHAGVPLYVLVDRWGPDTGQGEVTLFSEPGNGGYTSATKVPFGKEIHLPEPFGLTIDTLGFPA